MPIYVIACGHCGAKTDVYRRIAEMDDLPCCCSRPMQRQVCAPFVVGDQPAYQAMAMDSKTGRAPVIEGRSQHREFLRRNGYIEAADIPISPTPHIRGDFDVRRELTKATREVLSTPGHIK